MKKNITSILALTVICSVVAVLLAITNAVTAPIIEKNQAAAADEALLVVLPNGEEFTPVDLSTNTFPATVTKAYTEKNGGVVVELKTNGYGSDMIIMVGIDAEGKVAGAVCLSSNETLGYEKTYGEKTIGSTADTIDSLDTVSGATKTTEAYKNAVKDALNTALVLGGATIDVRDEAQIFADNLAAALPAAEGNFEKVFISEVLTDVSAVYKAVNGSGYVFISGENFVGTDANGNVVSQVDEALKATTAANAQLLFSSEMTEIDLTGYEMPKQIEKAYTTASGNYVFELKASGYGIYGDEYTKSGEHIKIKVSLTEDGTIIYCETTYQSESEGIGSVCADESFYSQFNGKTAETYGDIDTIAGATITTNGYKTAVSKAFEAITILKGEVVSE